MAKKTKAEKVRELLEKLHHQALDADNEHVREGARLKIKELCERARKTLVDFTDLLKSPTTDPSWGDAWSDAEDEPSHPMPPGAPVDPTDVPPGNALDLTGKVLQDYVVMEWYEYIASALWIAHTHVYQIFMHTPRWWLHSPVPGCGKTTSLTIGAQLTARGRKEDNITPAAIFRIIDRDHPTLLLDEGDNLGLLQNSDLRAVLNAGYFHGGSITRVHKDHDRRYSVFAPLAIGAIGSLPLPLQRRTIKIRMQHSNIKTRRLDLQDPACTDELNQVYAMLCAWGRSVQLDRDPALPAELRNSSQQDNWRPLIAVADSFGGEWPRVARAAAVEFARQLRRDEEGEHIGILALYDTREVFNTGMRDRVTSEQMIKELHAMSDGRWLECRGIDGNHHPRKLTQAMLASLLRPFGIHPHTIKIKLAGEMTTRRGYMRDWFARAWENYLDDGADTPTQSSNIRRLR